MRSRNSICTSCAQQERTTCKLTCPKIHKSTCIRKTLFFVTLLVFSICDNIFCQYLTPPTMDTNVLKSKGIIASQLLFPHLSSVFVSAFVLHSKAVSSSLSTKRLYFNHNNYYSNKPGINKLIHTQYRSKSSLSIASTVKKGDGEHNHEAISKSSLHDNINGHHGKKNDNMVLMEVDVRHDCRTALVYDPLIERYVEYHQQVDATCKSGNGSTTINSSKIKNYLSKFFKNAFLPEGVTESYYTYVKWKVIQRFINANVHVLGTQSLLLGLGKQNKKLSPSGASALGLSAVFNWVLKDALGKIVRMAWASKMGRKFDPDAKRWRYRSSLLFALGNGLEVMTYVYPALFLLLATMANACKQMGMLTSSATRNALYNSFRDGSRENIGDITAKGEAQIAIVDLIGIFSGVCLSRTIGTSVRAVFSVWIFLQLMEIFCVYKEIRAVVFRMLNFERLWLITNKFLDIANEHDFTNGSAITIPLPTPDIVAKDERIFMPPNHLARRAISFGSLSRAKLSPDELCELIDVFQNEKYILVVGQDLKNKRMKWSSPKFKQVKEGEYTSKSSVQNLQLEAQENCHIILHESANNIDIVKSTLALSILRRKLAARITTQQYNEQIQVNGTKNGMDKKDLSDIVQTQRSKDCMDLIREARKETDALFGPFLKVLSARGWATPARFMFGRVSMRTEWPIKKSH